MENQNQWCFAWYAQAAARGALRAALLKKHKWIPGDVITISFLDGDPSLQDRVKKAALQWTVPGLARLILDFRKNTTQTNIRISFKYEGSWSVIGTSCKNMIDETQPTMNFGWLETGTPDDEVNRVVLHEFGHALGLIHEHQSPAGGIRWNRKQVIKDLSGPPNNWPLSVINSNMFQAYKKKEANYTKTDPASIMMYPIPKSWTRNGFSAGLNSVLSPVDRNFIHTQYP